MSAASCRKFDYVTAPGDAQQINRLGDFFHAIQADGPFTVAWDDWSPTSFSRA